MSLPNTPHSDLESLIAAAQQGTIDEEQFFSALLDAQVFMPILDRHAIGGFQDSRAGRWCWRAKRGTAWCRSSPARIARANSCRTIRGMKGDCSPNFSWVIERIGSGIGISMNPGFDNGFDLEAEMLDALRDTTLAE